MKAPSDSCKSPLYGEFRGKLTKLSPLKRSKQQWGNDRRAFRNTHKINNRELIHETKAHENLNAMNSMSKTLKKWIMWTKSAKRSNSVLPSTHYKQPHKKNASSFEEAFVNKEETLISIQFYLNDLFHFPGLWESKFQRIFLIDRSEFSSRSSS